MSQTTSRYINALTDYGFKKIFGEKEIMMPFLNDLLQLASPIEDITYIDKEYGSEVEFGRGVVYDILCRSKNGEEFIVEMQNRSQAYFRDRILYYISRSFSNQGTQTKDHWDYKLKPVYGIFFLNFHLQGLDPAKVRTVQLKVEENGETFSDKLKIFTLELPEYRRMSESDCKTKIDYWLYNITNLETMMNIPFQTQQPAFRKVANIAEIVKMTPEERRKYNISIDTFRTAYAVMKNERQEGYEEGREEGRAEERKKAYMEKLALVRKGLSKGYDVATVAELTGLTEDEVKALQSS